MVKIDRKRNDQIVFTVILLAIFMFFLAEAVFFDVDFLVRYNLNLKILGAIFFVSELLFNLGIVLVLKGSGVLKLRWRDIRSFDFRKIEFTGQLVLVGFWINRLGAAAPWLYILFQSWSSLPWPIVLLIVSELLLVVIIGFSIERSLKDNKIVKTKIRKANITDVNAIYDVEVAVWGKNSAASKTMIKSRIEVFPDGQYVAVHNKKIIGFVASEIIQYDFDHPFKDWYEATDSGFIKNSHSSTGNVLFGIDLSVVPDSRGQKIGQDLLGEVAKVMLKYNLQGGMLGGRVPFYHLYADKMSIFDYVGAKNIDGLPLDPEIRFYTRAGLTVLNVLPDYFVDSDSLNYGILLYKKNPFWLKNRNIGIALGRTMSRLYFIVNNFL